MSSATPRLTPTIPRIRSAVEAWNKFPGDIWNMKASLDEAALITCFEIADEVLAQDPFPKSPGPFKILSSYCLAAQYFSPFIWQPPEQRRSFSSEERYWAPRLTVWTIPYIYEHLSFAQDGASLTIPMTFPTPHLQLEAINYLRIVHQSKQGTEKIDRDQMAEQVLLFGLCLEGAAYASFPDASRLAPVMKHAAKCVYDTTDPRWPDQFFMDRQFFEEYFLAGTVNVD